MPTVRGKWAKTVISGFLGLAMTFGMAACGGGGGDELTADVMMDDTMRVTDNTNVFRINGGYSYQRKYGLIFGYFSVTGDADANLYPVGEVTGSRTGKPDSNGFIAEINYLPWDHAKFALQYTAYNKFNGAKNDYDGSGRDASDNNTLYLLTNFMF